ncbi:MAG: hypothetical protein Q4D02_05510 [Clostridia bacterium]|nr:hypothetical protein [Clostridia bacterium]
MFEVKEFEDDKKYIHDFLSLPKKLYSKDEMMQNIEEERKILENRHILSKYFRIKKFLVYQGKEVVARCIVTFYDQDDISYIGFFECIDDLKCAKSLFDYVFEFVKKQGYKTLIGPVDASFWIKYRLKVNLFDKKPYTGEPYNKDYYLKLFQENGFDEKIKYVSNIFDVIPKDYVDETMKKRYQMFVERDYKIISPSKKDFLKCVNEIYDLIIELYKDFPVFKYIEREDFVELFSYYKAILNFDMVKLAYYDNKAVGFFLSVPNYHNRLYGKLNILDKLKILKDKKTLKSYVLLYMGVKREHVGLGKAIAYTILENAKKNEYCTIGALIKSGKTNEMYLKDKIENKYEYILLEKKL